MFHSHDWRITGQSFTPPHDTVTLTGVHIEGPGAGRRFQEMLDAARTGQTHIYLRCSKCGDVASRTVPGKFTEEG